MTEEKKEIKLVMPLIETNGRRGDQEAINTLSKQYQNQEIDLKKYLEGVRAAGGDLTFGNIETSGPLSERTNMETIMEAYQRGETTMHQMRALLEERGAESSFWDWELDPNPNYKSEETKPGFLWNPHFSKKGKFMQNITKRVLIKMCDFVFNSILKYDKDAFKFADQRLVFLGDYTEKYLVNNLTVEYKKDFVRKIIGAALFMCKEDVYYRVLLFKMINEAPHNFEITEEEMSYFNREVPKMKVEESEECKK